MEVITKNTLVSISLKTENKEIMYLHGAHRQIFQKLETELEGKKQGRCNDHRKDDIIFHQQ